MSQRHRSQGRSHRRTWTRVPTPTTSDIASTASSTPLQRRSVPDYEPDEVHEPGRAWVPSHHHDAEKARAGTATTASVTGS